MPFYLVFFYIVLSTLLILFLDILGTSIINITDNKINTVLKNIYVRTTQNECWKIKLQIHTNNYYVMVLKSIVI